MSDKDIEYIIWLAKRLVYKYKENESILTKVVSIIENNQKNLAIIDQYVVSSIENLSRINKFLEHFKYQNNTSLNKNTSGCSSIFENIDLSKIIK